MNTQIKTLQGSKTKRKRQSAFLTPIEHSEFKAWISEQATKIDAAETLGVSRGGLDDLEVKGRGKPENIAKIKKIIKKRSSRIAA